MGEFAKLFDARQTGCSRIIIWNRRLSGFLRFLDDGALMPSPDESIGVSYTIAPEVIRVACARVCGSAVFQLASNQASFLRFLVEQELSGKASQHRKDAVIAHFWGDRTKEDAEQKLIWAFGRLSEKLVEYYEGDGADDPICIRVNPLEAGLQFEENEGPRPNAELTYGRRLPRNWMTLAFLAVVLCATVGFVFWLNGADLSRVILEEEPDVQLGVQSDGPSVPEAFVALSAEELELQARGFLFPFLHMENQKRALAIAQEVIKRDPAYAQGFATAGYAAAALSLMTRGGGASKRFLAEAQAMREQAMKLDSDHPWVLSGAGITSYVEQDFANSMLLLEEAYDLAEDDIHIASTYISLAFVTHRYAVARDAAQLAMSTSPDTAISTPVRIHAFASFHLGDYEATLTTLEAAQTRSGLEHNVASLVYLAAAYQAVGRHDAAHNVVQRIQSDWPLFRPELLGRMFFQDQAEADFLMQNLAAAGWPFL